MVTRNLGEKPIFAGDAVNFAVDWTDWLDTDRDGTADSSLSSATWSIVNADAGLTVGSTSNSGDVSTATFTCAAGMPVDHVFEIKNTMSTDGSETFIAIAYLRVAG